jgi:GWxTD domain-containing protein
MRTGLTLTMFVLLLVISSCRSRRDQTSKPTKSLSNPDSDQIEVNAVAFHQNDSTSMVYLEVKNENLMYRRPDTSKAFYAELRIRFKMLSEPESKKILDSGSFYLADRVEAENVMSKSLFSAFKIRAKFGMYYFLDIEVADLGRRKKYRSYLNIYRQSDYSAQNFLVSSNDTVSFNNSFYANDKVDVKAANPSVRQVTVDCFFKEFGPALPPFSIKPPDDVKYKPDSIFSMAFQNGSLGLRMPPEGFYHIKANALSMEGITLYTFDKSFPGVSNSSEMIDCTRYIMNKQEFDECKSAPDQKVAIDNFWLNIGGSNERARELLKKYYGRVKEANKRFTSYTEGWKSDRGMIFIVFGGPTNVFHSKKAEVWIYGNESNPNSLRFIFNKTQNPFSDNDYILERSQFYRDHYHSAVDYWRQGNIYTDSRK